MTNPESCLRTWLNTVRTRFRRRRKTRCASVTSRVARPGCFTLIELLVVISIIAVLAAILLPSLQRATDLARSGACLNNQKQILLGWQMYCDEFDDNMPPSRTDGWGAGTVPPYYWVALVAAYAGAPCPDGLHFAPTRGVFFCPELRKNNLLTGNSSYGMHYYALGGHDYGTLKALRVRAQILYPSRQLLLMDSSELDLNHPELGKFYVMNPVYSGGNVSFRHANKTNVAFPDGHVEPLRYQDLRQDSAVWPNVTPWGWPR
jgi:prepilin-type processing-associated H-X9-DG protein/prepilin-type N-terminal cleavage/methylation domain-containing protein